MQIIHNKDICPYSLYSNCRMNWIVNTQAKFGTKSKSHLINTYIYKHTEVLSLYTVAYTHIEHTFFKFILYVPKDISLIFNAFKRKLDHVPFFIPAIAERLVRSYSIEFLSFFSRRTLCVRRYFVLFVFLNIKFGIRTHTYTNKILSGLDYFFCQMIIDEGSVKGSQSGIFRLKLNVLTQVRSKPTNKKYCNPEHKKCFNPTKLK